MSKAWSPAFGYRMRLLTYVVAFGRAGYEAGSLQELAEYVEVSLTTVSTWRREGREAWAMKWDGARIIDPGLIDLDSAAIWLGSGLAYVGVHGPDGWIGERGFVPWQLRRAGGPWNPAVPDLPRGRLHPDAGKPVSRVWADDRAARLRASLDDGVRRPTYDWREVRDAWHASMEAGNVPGGVTANEDRENARIVGVDAPDVTD